MQVIRFVLPLLLVFNPAFVPAFKAEVMGNKKARLLAGPSKFSEWRLNN
jgi:hypothetical protein